MISYGGTVKLTRKRFVCPPDVCIAYIADYFRLKRKRFR